MAFFGLFDLLIAVGLLGFLIGSIALLLLPRRVTKVGRVTLVWLLVASAAGTGLFILFNVAYFNGFGTDPVIGSPTVAQVTGTWVGSGGATLVLRPDGTFTATRLPADVGQATDFASGVSDAISSLATARGSSAPAISAAPRRA